MLTRMVGFGVAGVVFGLIVIAVLEPQTGAATVLIVVMAVALTVTIGGTIAKRTGLSK